MRKIRLFIYHIIYTKAGGKKFYIDMSVKQRTSAVLNTLSIN